MLRASSSKNARAARKTECKARVLRQFKETRRVLSSDVSLVIKF